MCWVAVPGAGRDDQDRLEPAGLVGGLVLGPLVLDDLQRFHQGVEPLRAVLLPHAVDAALTLTVRGGGQEARDVGAWPGCQVVVAQSMPRAASCSLSRGGFSDQWVVGWPGLMSLVWVAMVFRVELSPPGGGGRVSVL